MKTVCSILGLVFAVMAAYAAVRGMLLIIPAFINSGAETIGNERLFQSGAVYLGISMEGMAIILGMLAHVCFRSRNTKPRQPTGADTESEV